MPKIAIDVREACREKRTGKGQWTYGFTSELLKRSAIEVILLSDQEVPANWRNSASKIISFQKGLLWHFKVAKTLKTLSNLDLYLSPTSYIVPALLGKKVNVIPVVHDLIAFRSEQHDRKARIVEKSLLKRTLLKAAHICTVSESTKNDLLKRYSFLESAKVTPILAGPMREDEALNIPDHKTILCAGTLSPRKNQLSLIEAYRMLPKELKEQFKLILIGGRGWHDSEILKTIKETQGVEWKGHVTDDEYEALMRSCTVFALPSLYEGFGLQLLDALKRGVPILTSKRGSIPEVVGDCAVFINPEDKADIAQGLRRILTDEVLRGRLKTRGPEYAEQYSWQHSVDLFMQAVHDI
ncbi:MAG: glycosyltransferase family 1 protein [Patescibacteria group bacterium]